VKVAVIPSDLGACGYFRLIWPAEAVRSVRPEWQVDVYRPQDVKVAMGPRGLAVRGLHLEGLDLAVFQRIGTPRQVDLVRALQTAGIAVAIDVDDALYCIDPDSGSFPAWNDRRAATHWSNLEEGCKRADLVTVTTDALARHYGRHMRVERIVNGLPEGAFQDPSPLTALSDQVIVGWSGVAASHPHDLEVVGGALARVMASDPQVSLRVVGDAAWAAGVLQVPDGRWTDGGKHSLDKYHAALLGTDIGIVPLADTKFNEAKSALKALEYSGVGARVIASPTPANIELSLDTGLSIAKTPDAWYQALQMEVERVRTDRAEGVVGGPSVRHMGILPRAEEWAQAWERAVTRRKNLTN
jgi:hypothetical protein